jgi:hypothetical protein
MPRKEIHAAGQRARGGQVRALCGFTVARKDTGKGARVTCSLCQVVATRMAGSTSESTSGRGGRR